TQARKRMQMQLLFRMDIAGWAGRHYIKIRAHHADHCHACRFGGGLLVVWSSTSEDGLPTLRLALVVLFKAFTHHGARLKIFKENGCLIHGVSSSTASTTGKAIPCTS